MGAQATALHTTCSVRWENPERESQHLWLLNRWAPRSVPCQQHQTVNLTTSKHHHKIKKEEKIRSILLGRTKKEISLMSITRASNGSPGTSWEGDRCPLSIPPGPWFLNLGHILASPEVLLIPSIPSNLWGWSQGQRVPQVILICSQFCQPLVQKQKGRQQCGETGRAPWGAGNHTRGCVLNCWYLAPASCCHEGIGAGCCHVFWFVKNTQKSGYF